MRNTVYPGQRLSSGAERNLAELLNANLGAPLWAEAWGPLFNICEAASFWMLSPVPLALLAWRRARGERIDALAAAVALYALALSIYALIGVPQWLARATALGFVPGRRAVIGLGVADVILLARFAACARRRDATSGSRALAIALAGGSRWRAAALWLARELPDARLPVLFAFALANVALALGFLRTPRLALPALVALSAVVALVQPARGGRRRVFCATTRSRRRSRDRSRGRRRHHLGRVRPR